MLHNDLADQIPEDYVFIDLQKITTEGINLAAELKKAGTAGPIVISIAESSGEILAAIAGVMRGSISAIIFMIWIIFKIVCKTLWLGYSSQKQADSTANLPAVEISLVPLDRREGPGKEALTEDHPHEIPVDWGSDDEPQLSNEIISRKKEEPIESIPLEYPQVDATAPPVQIEGEQKTSEKEESQSWLTKITGGKL